MLFSGGNAAVDGQPFNYWFVGKLNTWAGAARTKAPDSDFGLRLSSTVEMKWGTHRAGEQRADWAGCADTMTMSLLVRGRFLLRFRSPTDRESIIERRLVKQGDYAIWGREAEHTWVVEEDAVIMTVRWKEGPAPPT